MGCGSEERGSVKDCTITAEGRDEVDLSVIGVVGWGKIVELISRRVVVRGGDVRSGGWWLRLWRPWERLVGVGEWAAGRRCGEGVYREGKLRMDFRGDRRLEDDIYVRVRLVNMSAGPQ